MISVQLDGLSLNIAPGGVQLQQLEIVEDTFDYLKRDNLLNTTLADGTKAGQVQSMSGKRYTTALAQNRLIIPDQDILVHNYMNKRFLKTSYSITGTGLPKTSALELYKKYNATVELQAKRAKNKTALADPLVTAEAKNELIKSIFYLDILLKKLSLELYLYDTAITVYFLDSSGCQFNDWIIADYVDFTFNLGYKELL